MNEDLNQIYDKIDEAEFSTSLTIEELCVAEPKLYLLLQSHYTDRILLPGRFTDASFDKSLTLPKNGLTIRENIRKIAANITITDLRK